MANSYSSESTSRDSSGFHRLHEQVQRWIWEKQWTELRDIQEQAIAPILSANTDLIIAAATAGGKTEAAFLPIFSKLMSSRETGDIKRGEGIQVLYISPLKALINDQYRRLSELGERLEIPVHPWHGDISSSRKQRVLRNPDGVLLITPEALEAMFVLRGHELTAIFATLQYVVVDELHSFIGIERGQQLRSLLHRLELAIHRRIPRIGLSATLGEMNLAKEYLRAGEVDAVTLIESSEAGQEIKLQIRGYRKIAPVFLEDESDQESEESNSRDEIDIANHLFKVLRGDKNLIFINRRQDVEKYADLLSRLCEIHHVPNEFMPHHGSLSKELREAAEDALKEDNRPANVVCTSTLELGIDIGAVTSIAQIGAPYSVSSTRQRLGRSGRRSGDPAILRIYITEPEITPHTHPEKALHPALVQAIAMTHLLLQGWYEPPRVGKLHLSTLVQQLLSLIAERGGIRPDRAWTELCEAGAFSEVDKTTYVQVLRCLGEQDLIQQTQEGLLLLGLTGERLVNHYSFYTAFKTPEEYRVTTVGKTLGTLPIDYPILEDSYLIFAGSRWQVLSVDRIHRVIDVIRAAAGRVPYFGGEPGLVHDRIRQEMFKIYTTEDTPIFLDATARDLLQEARANFLMYGLDHSPVMEYGHQTLLFPWAGSLVMNTLFIQFLTDKLEVDQGAIALTINDITPAQLLRYLKKLSKADSPDPAILSTAVRNKIIEKHDLFLSEELLCKNYATSFLDVERAWQVIRQIIKR
ncbi:MAG: DEAD/DEAH box helicase [Drouetiella hepatica Uher 2000/2452]|jgi:ATP-dependent Lhr-like helicase|uniref:DEAD/DEAH box helicase n=1 Tax=Drouetiella hepatica Uher 2000/2452 TaxID=904376 RepID=A0A951QB70_9CYAN|nr:DEAD/DEAH box helicase [Drouetiella hepatica Uher 2000/2452]